MSKSHCRIPSSLNEIIYFTKSDLTYLNLCNIENKGQASLYKIRSHLRTLTNLKVYGGYRGFDLREDRYLLHLIIYTFYLFFFQYTVVRLLLQCKS